MSRYIPTPAYPHSMPVDISTVFAEEKPAGKHGFVHADGDDLRFEDGTLARFWGVNINGSANFPEKDYADKFASRLAQAGVNLVRFHQLDAEWATHNIFQFRKNQRLTTTRILDPESLDRLDYLVYALKKQGIYLYMDLMTYRKFKTADGVELAQELKDSAKPFSTVNQRLIDLQKEFATQLWCHQNPYTGLAYKDDPAFVLTEITNECDLITNNCDIPAGQPGHSYSMEVRLRFRDWLEERGIRYDWETCDMKKQVQPILDFKIHLTRAYYREMYDHLRAIGVKIPITGTNWNKTPGLIPCQQDMDFTDTHAYFHKDFEWGVEEKTCAHIRITDQKSILAKQSAMKLAGKPFFISEWDVPWPNSYRAEAPIYYAAVCALQGWSGMAVHTYSYSTDLDRMEVLGQEVSSVGIGGIAYRTGLFSVWNDPAKFGLFQHAALIVRRGDVAPAEQRVNVKLTALEKNVTAAQETGLEMHRLATVLDDRADAVAPSHNFPWDGDTVRSDNGQLWRSLDRRLGAVDTPRTKVLYGRLGFMGWTGYTSNIAGTEVGGMKVKASTDFGVIALSSLTDAPIESSDYMLLTTIGRARNSGAEFDGDKMLELGSAPILSEVIRATITLKTDRTDLAVWGIGSEGYPVGKLNTKFENGTMTFTVGDKWPASYYLIVAE